MAAWRLAAAGFEGTDSSLTAASRVKISPHNARTRIPRHRTIAIGGISYGKRATRATSRRSHFGRREMPDVWPISARRRSGAEEIPIGAAPILISNGEREHR